jgi:hypothetical protein
MRKARGLVLPLKKKKPKENSSCGVSQEREIRRKAAVSECPTSGISLTHDFTLGKVVS